LGTGGNHLEPDLGYTVDVAALKGPDVELHLLLLDFVRPGVGVLKKCFVSYSNPFDSPF
jgi:hypothetical protein